MEMDQDNLDELGSCYEILSKILSKYYPEESIQNQQFIELTMSDQWEMLKVRILEETKYIYFTEGFKNIDTPDSLKEQYTKYLLFEEPKNFQQWTELNVLTR